MRWIGAVLLVLSVSVSYGQTPTPRVASEQPQGQGAAKQKKAAGDKRGTDDAPLVIKILPPVNDEKQPAQIAEKHKGQSAVSWWPTPEVWLVIFTAALFGATVLLWRSTVRMVQSAEESAGRQLLLAQDTAKRQLRAYIDIDTCGAMVLLQHTAYRVEIVYKNCGQTPAYKVRAIMYAGKIRHPLPADAFNEVPLTVPIPSCSLGPGNLMRRESDIKLLAPEGIAGIQHAQAGIYAFGRVTYEDVFGDSHTFRFRMVNDTFVHGKGWKMLICPEGNEAD